LKNKCGGNYPSDFRAGVTNAPRRRLFDEHEIPENKWCYIWRKTDSVDTAVEIEQHLIKNEGLKGGEPRAGEDSVFVYALG
jgi:hypothetical protein